MDLPWGDERTKQFVTNIGLITSNGPNGYNIMAAEWTSQVSYSPGLIAACIRPDDATHANIAETKEFGVSLCSAAQSALSSVSGGYSGKKFDKIKALEELEFKFFKSKKIDVLMVEDSAMNAECKLIKKIKLGDHTTFVGEVVELYPVKVKEPLVYWEQKYWKTGEHIPKPPQEEMDRIHKIVEKYKK